MKADLSDMPEYLKPIHHKKAGVAGFFAWVIGVCITLGVLHISGQAFLQETVKSLAIQPQATKTKPVAEIYRPKSETKSKTNWDQVVNEQAERDATPKTVEPPKQTVFNDQNYTARGADNVLSFNEGYQPIEQPKPANEGVRVTVVKETKDETCWPLREGSIERRDCKFATGLNRN